MNKRVLIVENDQDLLDILELILKQINVDVIKSQGWLLVSEIEYLHPDLILMDYLLDGKLGSDLCLEIKNTPSTKNIPVVFLSAHHTIAEIAVKSCADAYLAKPFELDDLMKLIKDFLEEK